MGSLLTVDDALVAGSFVDCPNRSVVRVRFDDEPERAFLGDPGALEGGLDSGRETFCSPVDDPDRATAHDAIAVRVGNRYVSLRTALANDLFGAALERGALPAFAGYSLLSREPELPDHGRSDSRLATPGVRRPTSKSSPVRPPTAPSRSSRIAEPSAADGTSGASRPWSRRIGRRTGFRRLTGRSRSCPSVSGGRSRLRGAMARARNRGFSVRAIAPSFDPPDYLLGDADLPVYVTDERGSI